MPLAMMTIGAVFVVCVTIVTCLVLVLRHLLSMRATVGEVSRLRSDYANVTNVIDQRLKAAEDKLTLLSNRIQSTR